MTFEDYPYLTRQEFRTCVDRFLAQYSAALSSSGIRANKQTSIAGSGREYLVLQQAVEHSTVAEAVAESLDIEVDIEDDDPSAPTARCSDTLSSSEQSRSIEYHAVYSASWRVPVLYVRMVSSTGEVTLDGKQLCDLVTSDSKVREAMAVVPFGGALGVVDHPELGVPFLYLHPCHTAELLRTVRGNGMICVGFDEYLAAWLSLSGSAVGLTLPTIDQ
ncbi:E2-like conjugating enzyme atg10 [Coemansia aciculifera]|nr:E2-like conjugating enzyme atg10 [Coemansia aciculifera]